MMNAPILTCCANSAGSRHNRSYSRGLFAFLLVLFLSIGLLSGCADTKLLDQFKKDFTAKNFASIAAQEVDCDKAGQTCAQLRLIKGDSCYLLAKQGIDAKSGYECAAHELAAGIALNPKWADPKERLQYHENLCESLRNLQDLQSGDAADKTLEQLAVWSSRLSALAPESLAAVYFVSKTTLRLQEKKLFDLNVETRGRVCMDLEKAHEDVKNMIRKQHLTPGPDWNRYRDNYKTLLKNLKRAMQVAGCQ